MLERAAGYGEWCEAGVSGVLYYAVESIGLSRCGGRKPSTLAVAARHNKREIQAEHGADSHIDAKRMHLNEAIAGAATAQDVVALANAKMLEAGIDLAALRKDYTQAVELMFSLPPGFTGDETAFFRICLEWAARRFGGDGILSADIHRDETARHCHVLMLPQIVDGRMRGSDAVARARSAETRQSLGREVARQFGMTMGAGKLAGGRKDAAAAMVLERIEKNAADHFGATLWGAFKAAIKRDPGPFLDALGWEPPARNLKLMAQIFTSPGKGARKLSTESNPKGFDASDANPIGFGGRSGGIGASGKNQRSPSLCMGFDDSTALSGADQPGEGGWNETAVGREGLLCSMTP